MWGSGRGVDIPERDVFLDSTKRDELLAADAACEQRRGSITSGYRIVERVNR
jgi:hypothetical protein